MVDTEFAAKPGGVPPLSAYECPQRTRIAPNRRRPSKLLARDARSIESFTVYRNYAAGAFGSTTCPLRPYPYLRDTGRPVEAFTRLFLLVSPACHTSAR